MEHLFEIWKKICESNLFNFVVMIGLLAYLSNKLKIGEKIESGRKAIEKSITDSETKRDESLNKLYKAQENVTKIDEEMLKILKNAEDNAHSLGSKLIEESNQQIELIKESSKKAIENNFKSVKNEILKETGEKAMQIAESKIKSELENNYDLHKKFIYESLDSLDNIGVQV